MRPTNNRNLHPFQIFAPQRCPAIPCSESRRNDETWDALEPRYNVAYFKLHGDFRNDSATDALEESPEKRKKQQAQQQQERQKPIARDMTARSALHSEEELRQPPHQVPSARSGHLMLPCPARRSLIIHGGLGLGQNDLLNDTWEYCIDEQRWIQLICNGSDTAWRRPITSNPDSVSSDEMPPKAFGQCGALFGGGQFLFVHGGVMGADQPVAGLPAFQLDIERRVWSQIPLSGQLPAMWGSVAQTLTIPVFDDAKMLHPRDHQRLVKKVVHGTDLSTRQSSPASATATTRRSTTVSQLSEGAHIETAGAAESHAIGGKSAPVPKRFVEIVVVFGGMQVSTAFNDTYYLYLTTPPPGGPSSYRDGEERVVLKLQSLSQSTFPGRRRACSAACKGLFLFIFGGRDSTNFYNDLWVLNVYTQQWVMVREETPLRYMREFFTRPYDWEPGRRVMMFIEDVLKVTLMERAVNLSQYCIQRNSSACRRTGAVMVSRGSDIFIHGGFTYDNRGLIDTHQDIHVYNYMRHVWRPVNVVTGCKMRRFPIGYLKPMSDSTECTGALQWEKVRELISSYPDGRTMAAMCADPIQPGHRFFLFGGRSEDEARGELYDVRVTVFHPSVGALYTSYAAHFYHFMMAEGEEEEEAEVLAMTAQALPEGSSIEGNSSIMSYFRAEKATQRKYVIWGKRRLCDQAVDWVRAIVQEESALQRTVNNAKHKPKNIYGLQNECLNVAYRIGAAMKQKVDLIVPVPLQAMLTWAPAFAHCGRIENL